EHPGSAARGSASWAKIVNQLDEQFLQSLAWANFSGRLVTQREIAHRGERFRPALLQIVATPDYGHDARLLALGALESFWKDDVRRTFIHVLSDADADLVRLAAD